MPRQTWIDLTILAVLTLVVHGLLLVDPGIYFDDWFVYTFVVRGEWDELTKLVRDRGIVPIEQYYWWMFRDLPVHGYRAAVFLMIIGLAWLATLLGRTSSFLSRQESLLVGVFMVCYSGFQTWVLLCTSQYVFFYLLFLAGALLALQAEREGGWRHWVRRGAALGLLAVSYCLASLLVLTMGLGVILLVYLRKLHRLTSVQVAVTYLPRRLDYFALPILYWFAVKWLIPPRGQFETYNQFLPYPIFFVAQLKTFLINSVVVQLQTGLVELARYPAVIAVAVALALIVWNLGRRRTDPPPTPAIWVLTGALLWLACAMFPYVIVGKPAEAVGWWSRHAILVSFPLGVAIVGLARLFEPRRADRVSPITIVATITLAAGMAITTTRNYVDVQARAVKDRSVMQQLAAMPEAREISVFWIEDRLPKAFGEDYRYYEWAAMFESIFGDQARAGFDRTVYRSSEVLMNDTRFFTSRFRLKDFDPAGCQAVVTIDRGNLAAGGLDPRPGSWPIVRTYHSLRLNDDPEALTTFLNRVTEVSLQPLDAPEAVHCQRSGHRR
jgi:hypothetical protein